MITKKQLIQLVGSQFNLTDKQVTDLLNIDRVLNIEQSEEEQLNRINQFYNSNKDAYTDINDFIFNYFVVAYHTYYNVNFR